jgi:hypothetical protein
VCHWCRRNLLPVAGWPELEYDVDNVVLSCYGCNRRKDDRLGPSDVVDIHGMKIIDLSVKCMVHDPILAHLSALRLLEVGRSVVLRPLHTARRPSYIPSREVSAMLQAIRCKLQWHKWGPLEFESLDADDSRTGFQRCNHCNRRRYVNVNRKTGRPSGPVGGP